MTDSFSLRSRHWCEWPEGEWIAYHRLGQGYGYQACMDCVKHQGNDISAADCDGWCTCLSTCICCECTSAADVEAEMRRLGQVPAQ
jgi:hypothetical protein